MGPNGIAIAVGQKWKTRSGELCKITEILNGAIARYPVHARFDSHGVQSFTLEGRYRFDDQDDLDLVELVNTAAEPDSGPLDSSENEAVAPVPDLPEPVEVYLVDPNEDLTSLGKPLLEASAPQSALEVQEGGQHYKSLAIQPIEFIHANNIGFAEGNVIKYVTRWRSKNGIADLKKARHYIDLLIELESKKVTT